MHLLTKTTSTAEMLLPNLPIIRVPTGVLPLCGWYRNLSQSDSPLKRRRPSVTALLRRYLATERIQIEAALHLRDLTHFLRAVITWKLDTTPRIGWPGRQSRALGMLERSIMEIYLIERSP
jgi:hypothetical protein